MTAEQEQLEREAARYRFIEENYVQCGSTVYMNGEQDFKLVARHIPGVARTFGEVIDRLIEKQKTKDVG